MKKYKCKASFWLPIVDYDDFQPTNESRVIENGEVFYLYEMGYDCGFIHLINIKDGSCIDIGEQRLKECFELVEEK